MNTHLTELYASAAIVIGAGLSVLSAVAPLPDGGGARDRNLLRVTAAAWARRPRVTPVLLVAVALSALLQYAVPGYADAIQRTPGTLSDGQWWRLITALFDQSSGAMQITVNLAALLGAGAVAEWALGPARWLLVFLGSGVAANVVSVESWSRHGGGCSVAICGLVAAVAVTVLLRGGSPALPAAARRRSMVLAALVPAAGVFLCVIHNNHGMGLVAGAVLAVPLVLSARPGSLRLGLG
ncbi:hypothetical protein GCM10009665_20290 [Kitasatospora nipponensis]|uniref:Peptidase S54 rhomboid domain-containing protein n=1 Tax=Kitasatospora nipponensis TaxID=258049 RepID=A0ABP4GNV9_9ACTN